MAYNTLSLETRGKTLIITINRPNVYNALNREVIAELGLAFKDFFQNESWLGAILTGAGDKAFAAGADISEINGLSKPEAQKLSETGQVLFEMIESGSKPVIAAVNGFALGGGCELCMSCHMRVASDNAKFGQPEVNLGLIAGYGGTQRLPRLIGRTKATELLLTGDAIKASQALELGLVNYVTTQDELLGKCEEILEKIYTKSPLAIAHTLHAIHEGWYDLAKGFKVENQKFAESAASHDGWEGTQAFLEKRKPAFKGN
ncbi:MAG: enoyl-CoA hydratase/isomerase family protein [Bacteroidia bacterium]|nr:enoyl-CoA hydratase/isomerase family protein [Bacteroidia bacterium]